MNTIGHNSGTLMLSSALVGLDLALKEARVKESDVRDQMIIVARWLAAVDHAAADNEELADSEIRASVRLHPADLISGKVERNCARWMARGGIEILHSEKNPNEINDLSEGSLNRIEKAFRSDKRFEKCKAYGSVLSSFSRSCKVEIRKALDGKDGPTIDEIRAAYGGVLFKAETVEGWITEEQYRRTDNYARLQELRKACSIAVDKAEDDEQHLRKLEDLLKDELKEIRRLAAQARAEKEAKEGAPRLTPDQRRRNADAYTRAETDPLEEYHED